MQFWQSSALVQAGVSVVSVVSSVSAVVLVSVVSSVSAVVSVSAVSSVSPAVSVSVVSSVSPAVSPAVVSSTSKGVPVSAMSSTSSVVSPFTESVVESGITVGSVLQAKTKNDRQNNRERMGSSEQIQSNATPWAQSPASSRTGST